MEREMNASVRILFRRMNGHDDDAVLRADFVLARRQLLYESYITVRNSRHSRLVIMNEMRSIYLLIWSDGCKFYLFYI